MKDDERGNVSSLDLELVDGTPSTLIMLILSLDLELADDVPSAPIKLILLLDLELVRYSKCANHIDCISGIRTN